MPVVAVPAVPAKAGLSSRWVHGFEITRSNPDSEPNGKSLEVPIRQVASEERRFCG
jgi:hypothetical protein